MLVRQVTPALNHIGFVPSNLAAARARNRTCARIREIPQFGFVPLFVEQAFQLAMPAFQPACPTVQKVRLHPAIQQLTPPIGFVS
jgi:hypothetical protein